MISFRDSNTPLFLKLKFSCPSIQECARCSLTLPEKKALLASKLPLPKCPFAQWIQFMDSISHISYPLGSMIEDLNLTADKSKVNRSTIFPCVYQYLGSLGLNDQEQELTATSKLTFPFEKIDSINYLENTIAPPPPTDFHSILRSEGIDTQSYKLFCDIWRTLKVSNMLQLMKIYAVLDVLYLNDCLAYYFDQIHKITGHYPSYYQTISSLALDAALRHSHDPVKTSTIQLEMLSEPIYKKFETMLIGKNIHSFIHSFIH